MIDIQKSVNSLSKKRFLIGKRYHKLYHFVNTFCSTKIYSMSTWSNSFYFSLAMVSFCKSWPLLLRWRQFFQLWPLSWKLSFSQQLSNSVSPWPPSVWLLENFEFPARNPGFLKFLPRFLVNRGFLGRIPGSLDLLLKIRVAWTFW